MASFGRNFDFRVPPKAEARGGRFLTPSTVLSGSGSGGGTSAFTVSPGQGGVTLPGGLLPIGAPVVADTSAGQDSYGRQYVKLATASTGPTGLLCGVLVYQYGPAAYAGFDPVLATYADLGYAPVNAPCILVRGDPATKVVFRNTIANSFLGLANYPGRVMVNGLSGGSPDITVGDYLTPYDGDDVDGYWISTATSSQAWMIITHVDTTRLEVEAQMLF